MNRLPSLVSPFMATKTVPGRTRRESYSTPATAGFPLCERTSAPCKSCWNVIAAIITSSVGVSPAHRPSRWHRSCPKATSPSKLHHHARSSRHVRAGLGRLFACNAAADGVEVEPGILRRLNRNAQIFANEGWDLDPSLFHVEHHRSTGRRFLRE